VNVLICYSQIKADLHRVRDQGPCMDQLIDDMRDLVESMESVFQEKEERLEI